MSIFHDRSSIIVSKEKVKGIFCRCFTKRLKMKVSRLLIGVLLVINIWTGFALNFVKNIETQRINAIVSLAKAACKALEESKITEVNLILEKGFETNDLVEVFVRSTCGKIKVNIRELNAPDQTSKSFTSFLLLENESSFEENVIRQLSADNFYYDGNFLLFFSNQQKLNMTKLFNSFWKRHIFNVNIIWIMNESVDMITFIPYSKNGCESSKPRTLSSFDGNSWKNLEMFPKKFTDFHGCPIIISTFDYPPAVIDGKEDVNGHDIDLVRGLSTMMNFTFEIKVLNEPAAWGFVMENGTSGGVMKKIMDGEADIGIGSFYLTLTRAKFMSFSEYSRTYVVLTVPSGVPLTQFEKLFSPFSSVTWIVLLLTFMAAIFIISVVRLQKKSVQNFVFGIKTGNPYVNLLNIVLNGFQNVIPRRNFARALLNMFLFFCIIIRTLYQASLFIALQTDQRHPELQTFEEVLAKDFDVYMYESFLELSEGLKIHQRQEKL